LFFFKYILGGLIRPGGAWETDLTPSRLRQAIRRSYESLGGQKPIPLWQIHNSPQDNKYSLKEIFQPICEAVELKLIQYVGVSNFNIEQIKEVQTYIKIHSVQNVFNIFKRQSETDGIIKYCEDNDLTFLAYSPMGGRRKHKKLNKDKLLINLGEKYYCSPYCIVLSWILSKSKCIVPIPGASKITSIEDSIKALYIHLNQDDIDMINKHKFI
jgi:pyridoxine 4-dehydrogenase